jgi:hypothetical protein
MLAVAQPLGPHCQFDDVRPDRSVPMFELHYLKRSAEAAIVRNLRKVAFALNFSPAFTLSPKRAGPDFVPGMLAQSLPA